MNKLTTLTIIFFGLLLMIIGLTRNSVSCPQQQIIYRYIPRTFEEEQEAPVYPSEIFKTMFTQQSPWIGSINDIDTRKKESINKYFISQM